jgi:hypothetical protein
VEDVLKKLDKLTHEEAQAVAQNLKVMIDLRDSGAPVEGAVQPRMLYRSRLRGERAGPPMCGTEPSTR